MPSNSYTYKLIIKHFNSLVPLETKDGDNDISNQSLIFNFNDKTTIERDVRGESTSLMLKISSLKFHREVYKPNEITADISIEVPSDKSNSLPSLSDLRTMFLKKPAELNILAGSDTVIKAENLFVYEIEPVFKTDQGKKVDIKLKIFSIDKLMAIDKYSQAYLGRKLKGEILQSVKRFSLGYKYLDKNGQEQTDTSNSVRFNNDTITNNTSDPEEDVLKLQHLAYDTEIRTKDSGNKTINRKIQREFIQPYLIQYNEGFYDFLVRISNRCGEFLYFDDGRLNIGLKTTPDEDMTVPKDDPYVKSKFEKDKDSLALSGYESISFQNISDGILNVNDFARDSIKDQILGWGDKSTSNFKGSSRLSAGEKIYKFTGDKRDVTYPKDMELIEAPGGEEFEEDGDIPKEAVFDFNKPSKLDSSYGDSSGSESISYTDIDKKQLEIGDIKLEISASTGGPSPRIIYVPGVRDPKIYLQANGGTLSVSSDNSIEKIEFIFEDQSEGYLESGKKKIDKNNNIYLSNSDSEKKVQFTINSEVRINGIIVSVFESAKTEKSDKTSSIKEKKVIKFDFTKPSTISSAFSDKKGGKEDNTFTFEVVSGAEFENNWAILMASSDSPESLPVIYYNADSESPYLYLKGGTLTISAFEPIQSINFVFKSDSSGTLNLGESKFNGTNTTMNADGSFSLSFVVEGEVKINKILLKRKKDQTSDSSENSHFDFTYPSYLDSTLSDNNGTTSEDNDSYTDVSDKKFVNAGTAVSYKSKNSKNYCRLYYKMNDDGNSSSVSLRLSGGILSIEANNAQQNDKIKIKEVSFVFDKDSTGSLKWNKNTYNNLHPKAVINKDSVNFTVDDLVFIKQIHISYINEGGSQTDETSKIDFSSPNSLNNELNNSRGDLAIDSGNTYTIISEKELKSGEVTVTASTTGKSETEPRIKYSLAEGASKPTITFHQYGGNLIVSSEKPIDHIEFKFAPDSGGTLTDEDGLVYDKKNNLANIAGDYYVSFAATSEVILNEITVTHRKEEIKILEDEGPENYRYNSEIAHDEFFMPLYSEGFGGTEFVENYLGTPEKNWTHVVAVLLNSSSILDFALNTALEYGKAGFLFLMYKKEMNKRGKSRFITPNSFSHNKVENEKEIPVVVPFSEDELKRWTTLEYYSEIKRYEQEQESKMVDISFGSNFRNYRLGDIFIIEEDGKTPYVVCDVKIEIELLSSGNEDENPDLKASQTMRAIPMLSATKKNGGRGWKAYPPVSKNGVFRKSGPQTAFVVDAADPKRQGRVRIRYPWQTDNRNIPAEDIYISRSDRETWDEYNKTRREAASPWIRMTMPSASQGTGFYFEPEPGDEVMVNFENDNIERPYVVGALYSKDAIAPVGKGRRVIVSKHGHTIRFKDPSDGVGEISDSTGIQRVLGQISPLYDAINFWTKGNTKNFTSKEIENMTGGIDISDAYGLYKISMSSDERAITINSPLGDISLNAFTGITISAPNGDITIKGKNIDLLAANKINIVSGGNLKKGIQSFWFDKKTWTQKDYYLQILKKNLLSAGSPFDLIQPVDMGLLRSVLEVLVKPVNGTLVLKSHGFLKLEAGYGETEIPYTNYSDAYKQLVNLKDNPQSNQLVMIYNKIGYVINKIDGIIDQYYTEAVNILESIINEIHNFYNVIREDNRTYTLSLSTKDLINNFFNRERYTALTYQNVINPLLVNELIRTINNENNPDNADRNNNNQELAARIESSFQDAVNGINDLNQRIWRFINDENTGCLNRLNFNFIGSRIDQHFINLIGQNIAGEIGRLLREAYDNNRYLFSFKQVLLSAKGVANRMTPDYNFQNMEKLVWDGQAKSLKRDIVKQLLSRIPTIFPNMKVNFDFNVNVESSASWNLAVSKLEISPVEPRDSWSADWDWPLKIADYLYDISDFSDSWTIWNDPSSIRGKILMSDEETSTLHFNRGGNGFVKHLNQPSEEVIIEKVEGFNNQLRDELYKL